MQPPTKKQRTGDVPAENFVNANQQNWGCQRTLPPELSMQIFRHLNMGEIFKASQVCREWRNLLSDERIWQQFSNSLHFPDVFNDALSHKERVGCQAAAYHEAATRILWIKSPFPLVNVPTTLATVRIWRAVILENKLGSLNKISSLEEQNSLSSQENLDRLLNASRSHDILSVWKGIAGPFKLEGEVEGKFKSWVERNRIALLNKKEHDFRLKSLSFLPEEISKMSNLRTLCLYGNALESLPESIGSLIHLEKLDVSENFLPTLPSTIGNLGKLRVLDVGNNFIFFLPETLAGLRSLKELYLKENRLVELPKSFGLLNELDMADLRNNRLRLLPNKLPIQISSFDVGSNRLEVLPQSIGELKQLKLFSVHGNRLKSLPPIQELNLESLYLSENPLSSLPVTPPGLERLILDNRQWENFGRSRNLRAKKVSVIHNEKGVGIFVRNFDLEQANPLLG